MRDFWVWRKSLRNQKLLRRVSIPETRGWQKKDRETPNTRTCESCSIWRETPQRVLSGFGVGALMCRWWTLRFLFLWVCFHTDVGAKRVKAGGSLANVQVVERPLTEMSEPVERRREKSYRCSIFSVRWILFHCMIPVPSALQPVASAENFRLSHTNLWTQRFKLLQLQFPLSIWTENHAGLFLRRSCFILCSAGTDFLTRVSLVLFLSTVPLRDEKVTEPFLNLLVPCRDSLCSNYIFLFLFLYSVQVR